MGLSIVQYFMIAKFITLFIPMQFVMPHNTMIALNIIEAIVTDLCMNRIECYCNAFFGSALIILLYKKVKSPLGFKLWSILYTVWNTIFIYTKGYTVFLAIANNLPALYYTLGSQTDRLDHLRICWGTCRCAAIMTQIITMHTSIKR
jgi:hypothetical protein